MLLLDSHTEIDWQISENIPEAFVGLIRKYVADQTRQRTSYHRIASELGVSPAILSRWLAGMGPLSEKNILGLSKIFGLSIYLTCGLKLPDKKISDEVI